MIMKFEPTIKQYVALMYLGVLPLAHPDGKGGWEYEYDELGYNKFDMETTALGYGGAAGGGKSRLGCEWLTMMCLRFPGTRWFIGRRELKVLKRTVLPTLYQVFRNHGLERDEHFTYNDIKSEFTFENGSQILLLDLLSKPSDPLFTEYGSLEVTGGWFEEANELEENAYEILQSRCRYMLEDFCPYCTAHQTSANFVRTETIENPNTENEDDATMIVKTFKCHECNREHHGIPPRTLCTFNPDKGWVYARFYRPFRDKKLKSTVRFIPALATDNPYLPASYVTTLKGMKDKIKRERLLKGNFEYDDTPGRLFNYDQLQELFTKKTQDKINEERMEVDELYKQHVTKFGKTITTDYDYWISCDPARYGEDLAVIGLWNKLSLVKICIYFTSDIMKDLYAKISDWRAIYRVPNKHIIVDSDGVGGGLVDALGCKGFINNATPIQPKNRRKDPLMKENYQNLKTQCVFELSETIESIAISLDDIEVHGGTLSPHDVKTMIIEELDVIVQIEMDRDGPTKIIKKEDIKSKIRRSPNFLDMMTMRMYWLIKPPLTAFVHK